MCVNQIFCVCGFQQARAFVPPVVLNGGLFTRQDKEEESVGVGPSFWLILLCERGFLATQFSSH
jgi:hypothetical protein